MPLKKTQSLKGSATAAALLLAGSIMPADAHTWVEQARRVAPNGTFVGEPGYARGMMGRGQEGFEDSKLMYLLPPNERPEPIITEDDNIAKFGIGSYTEQFPKLGATAGELVALRYQENGHVSLPQNTLDKPLNSGTVYIYGTEKASDDDKILDILHQWTTDGKGGDGRGKLIATRNFDDGQCHEANAGDISTARAQKFQKQDDALQGPKLWCQVDVRIPEDVTAGSTYTMYWVWDWPTLQPELVGASENGEFPTQGDGVVKPEVYTSTVDINILAVDDATNQNFAQPGKSAVADFDPQQDIGNMAIQAQADNMFIVSPPKSDTEPVDGGDENSIISPSAGGGESSPVVPSAGTGSAAPSVTDAPQSEAPIVTGAPESPQATVTVTVTKEPTTLTTVVTQAPVGCASAPPSIPTGVDNGPASGTVRTPRDRARRRGVGLF